MFEVRVERWSPGHAHYRASIVMVDEEGSVIDVVGTINHPFAREERAWAVAEQELERLKGGRGEPAT